MAAAAGRAGVSTKEAGMDTLIRMRGVTKAWGLEPTLREVDLVWRAIE